MHHIRTVTAKGQVTIPADIRRMLGIKPNDQVVFRVIDQRVEIEAMPMTLEEAFGSVAPLEKPVDLDTMRRIIREERVERALDDSAVGS